MKSYALSVLLIGVVALLLGGGTLAIFSDTETSSNNVFAAGTLDLKVDGNDDPNVPAYFSESNIKPGDSGGVTISVANAGTIDGSLSIMIANVSNDPGATTEPEPTPDNGELGSYLELRISYDSDGDGICDTIIAENTIDSLENQVLDAGSLAAGQSKTICIDWRLPNTVGNDVQDDSVTFNIVFSLSQPVAAV